MAEPAVYAQCGLRLRSELELDLPTVAGDGWDVEASWGPDVVDSASPPPGEVIAAYESEEGAWYTATATAEGYRVRFRECGEFVFSHDLAAVEVRRDRAGRHELLPILLAGTVSAFVLAMRGATVLHASAVALDGSTMAFVGQSGRGKTTLAALMCVEGAALVTDDVLTVDPGPPVTCLGGARELRLRSSAAPIASGRADAPTRTTADERVAFAPRPAPLVATPLTAIVIPSPSRTDAAVRARRLPPSDALFALIAFPRVHGWRRPDVLSRDFATLGRVVNDVPVYEAVVPWGPPFDPAVAPALAELAVGA